MAIRENILKLREIFDLTQDELAKIAGVTRGAVSQWEGGFSEPRMGAIQKMADYFGITKSNIIEDNGMDQIDPVTKKLRPSNQTSRSFAPKRSASAAPIVGDVAAGDTSEAFQIVSDELTLPEGIAERHPHACFLRVSGESMNKLFQHGEFVLYDPDEEVRDGDVAVVYVNGDEATVKRVYFAGDMVVLHPESTVDEFRDRAIDTRDPAAPSVTFAGKVVWKTLGDTEVKF